MTHKSDQNTTPHLPEDYDVQVSNTIPYYSSFHQETINLIKSLPFRPKVWLDTGCGTGSLVKKAILEFPDATFILVDSSESMLQQALEKLSVFMPGRSRQTFSQVWRRVFPYYYITIEDHLKLLRETGFRNVELFWCSYMQAGFYGIK
jgi:tRNA (cmo5U34)-methyltransferase